MALISCPDCGTQVSDQAPACPKCGRPVAGANPEEKVDKEGAWCPHCGNRESFKQTDVGCLYGILVAVTLGGALLFYPLLPRTWICLKCSHRWKV